MFASSDIWPSPPKFIYLVDAKEFGNRRKRQRRLPAPGGLAPQTSLLSRGTDVPAPNTTFARSSEQSLRDYARVASASSGPSSEASFLGLPPELRLIIYGYLLHGESRPGWTQSEDFDDDWQPQHVDEGWDSEDGEDRRPHVCSYWPERGSEVPLKCICAKPVYTDILAVSRDIFAEAMPELYQSFELRFDVPPECTYGNKEDVRIYDDFLAGLASIPLYGRRRIRKLLLVASIPGSALASCCMCYTNARLPSILSDLNILVPSVTSIRLALHLGANARFLERLTEIDGFAVLLRFTKVTSLTVEILVDYNPEKDYARRAYGGSSREEKEHFKAEVVQALEFEAKRLKRDVKVDVVLLPMLTSEDESSEGYDSGSDDDDPDESDGESDEGDAATDEGYDESDEGDGGSF